MDIAYLGYTTKLYVVRRAVSVGHVQIPVALRSFHARRERTAITQHKSMTSSSCMRCHSHCMFTTHSSHVCIRLMPLKDKFKSFRVCVCVWERENKDKKRKITFTLEVSELIRFKRLYLTIKKNTHSHGCHAWQSLHMSITSKSPPLQQLAALMFCASQCVLNSGNVSTGVTAI